ncbi:GNAT family N-acetyltransferase [Nonomuraea sp. NPDC026600]|uniref:GNAT family N-acetyltransferase n=1 Tax=Nonomuraea sp. NPDC026600 TaxID=3155363 RepID=UPI0033D43C42
MMVSESLRLRPADPGDYDRIVAVVDDWWGRPIRSILPRLFLDHFHRTSMVAEEDGELVGFLIGFLSPSVADAAYIHFVGIDPRLRGSGLGRLLYQRFFELARAGHRTSIRAITSPQNHGSIAFHTAMGFTVMGPVPDYDGPEVDRIIFQLHLKSR